LKFWKIIRNNILIIHSVVLTFGFYSRHLSVQNFLELPLIKEFNEYSNDDKCLLRNYIHSNLNEEKLDIDLLLSLLVYIFKNTTDGKYRFKKFLK
jgi:hypothetical protein